MGCPGGGKEATQYPLSTGNCNYQASEEERPNQLRSDPGRDSLSSPLIGFKRNFQTLREAYRRLITRDFVRDNAKYVFSIWKDTVR